MRESEVSMQLDVASCNPSWFACNIFICRMSTACAFICQCHWGSSSTPSLWILSRTLDESIAQAPLHCCHRHLLYLVLIALLLPLLLRSTWTLMRIISSCEFIRRCQWSRSCGLWSIVSCVPRLQGHHHWLPTITASMMCLLHCSCFTQGVGIGRCSCASCWWSERFPSLIASLD